MTVDTSNDGATMRVPTGESSVLSELRPTTKCSILLLFNAAIFFGSLYILHYAYHPHHYIPSTFKVVELVILIPGLVAVLLRWFMNAMYSAGTGKERENESVLGLTPQDWA